MCKIDPTLIRDDECKRQYVAEIHYLGDDYHVVCNVQFDGTTDIVPVNDRGKVNDEGKTFVGTSRPTAAMIRETLRIRPWESCSIELDRVA